MENKEYLELEIAGIKVWMSREEYEKFNEFWNTKTNASGIPLESGRFEILDCSKIKLKDGE